MSKDVQLANSKGELRILKFGDEFLVVLEEGIDEENANSIVVTKEQLHMFYNNLKCMIEDDEKCEVFESEEYVSAEELFGTEEEDSKLFEATEDNHKELHKREIDDSKLFG